jgi:hypothetical protein
LGGRIERNVRARTFTGNRISTVTVGRATAGADGTGFEGIVFPCSNVGEWLIEDRDKMQSVVAAAIDIAEVTAEIRLSPTLSRYVTPRRP